jgi:hypothetical protein
MRLVPCINRSNTSFPVKFSLIAATHHEIWQVHTVACVGMANCVWSLIVEDPCMCCTYPVFSSTILLNSSETMPEKLAGQSADRALEDAL